MKKLTLKPSKDSSNLEKTILESKEYLQLGFGKTYLRKIFLQGMVYVNGRRIKNPHLNLKGSEIIDLYYDVTSTPKIISESQFLPLRVLYEDNALYCIEKPAGLPSQPTVDKSRPNAFDLALKQVKDTEFSYLGMHHRLDRDTSGVLLFSRAEKYNKFIADQFSSHDQILKNYVAVVHGKLKRQQGRLETFLAETGRQGKITKFGSVKKGGKKAITDYLVLGESSDKTLIEVKILTGRTHQIRVHLSEMGNPIVGDTLYGSPVKNYSIYGRFLLHAHALTITHPITQNRIRIESPVPQEFRI